MVNTVAFFAVGPLATETDEAAAEDRMEIGNGGRDAGFLGGYGSEVGGLVEGIKVGAGGAGWQRRGRGLVF